jgi:hypothetical protein
MARSLADSFSAVSVFRRTAVVCACDTVPAARSLSTTGVFLAARLSFSRSDPAVASPRRGEGGDVGTDAFEEHTPGDGPLHQITAHLKIHGNLRAQ